MLLLTALISADLINDSKNDSVSAVEGIGTVIVSSWGFCSAFVNTPSRAKEYLYPFIPLLTASTNAVPSSDVGAPCACAGACDSACPGGATRFSSASSP